MKRMGWDIDTALHVDRILSLSYDQKEDKDVVGPKREREGTWPEYDTETI